MQQLLFNKNGVDGKTFLCHILKHKNENNITGLFPARIELATFRV